MIGTIESTHSKITDRLNLIYRELTTLHDLCEQLLTHRDGKAGIKKQAKYQNWQRTIDSMMFNLCRETADLISADYDLGVATILGVYYSTSEESRATKEYYRVVISNNIIGRLHNLMNKIRNSAIILSKMHRSLTPAERCSNELAKAMKIPIDVPIEKKQWEMCKCGARMQIVPEVSELHCTNESCGRQKTIIGAVFRDDQYYPQDGQKTKHGGYDTSRHYRFWMERLQASEAKAFTDLELAKIEKYIVVTGICRRDLTCERMRDILKDPSVASTHLNDHAPLLVKMFGGPAPPQLSFAEYRTCSIRFNRAMKLYDLVNPTGGNKPYYPYFIYKILEVMFKDDHEKLRLIDYIHLQSRETVIKNDNHFKKMCELASPDDGLVYSPTDPAGRF